MTLEVNNEVFMRSIFALFAVVTVIATPAYADDACAHTKRLVIEAKRTIDASFQNAGVAAVDINQISNSINNSDDIETCSAAELDQLQKAMDEFRTMGM